MNADMLAKNDLVIDGGLRSLEICKRAGAVAYGAATCSASSRSSSRASSSCAAKCSRRLRSSARPPRRVRTAAHGRQAGTLRAGAFADIILVDGDLLKDLACSRTRARPCRWIVKGGVFHKNTLH